MSFDFSFYLTCAVILTGVVTLFYRFLPKRTSVMWMRSIFPVLLIVWVIRSFIVQPYHVPTGSLAPTVLPGDFIAVEQFAYGLRLPVLNTKILPIGEPKRGQVALFRWPVDPSIYFVKRVIGLPGDHIVYKNKVLFINGKEAQQTLIRKIKRPSGPALYLKIENLDGVKHKIYVRSSGGETKNIDVTVPPGHYFMMGDNRDDSDDSRQWGFVSEENLIGKAFLIWMSAEPNYHGIRWQRIGIVL